MSEPCVHRTRPASACKHCDRVSDRKPWLNPSCHNPAYQDFCATCEECPQHHRGRVMGNSSLESCACRKPPLLPPRPTPSSPHPGDSHG